MNSNLKQRTKLFCINCIRFTELLPKTFLGNYIKGQLIRCSSPVAANYRAANLAQSTAAFVSKIRLLLKKLMNPSFGSN